MSSTQTTRKYGRVDVARAADLYTIQHLTLREIAAIMGCTHAAIAKAIRKYKVTAVEGEHVQCVCAHCAGTFSKTRSAWRHSKRHYCTEQCYFDSLENPQLVLSRTGCKAARCLVMLHFELLPSHVVHHHDSDETHNTLRNLCVFATRSEHAAYERGVDVKPIWDGRR